jgi:hypothetical protein
MRLEINVNGLHLKIFGKSGPRMDNEEAGEWPAVNEAKAKRYSKPDL